MFFAGVDLGGRTRSASIVVVEKHLKNLKKHYSLRSVVRFPRHTECSQMEEEILGIFKDRNFVVNRRVFSQDRRPAKNIRTPPTILVRPHSGDTSIADRLREKKIPTQAIILCHGDAWKREDYGSLCLGHNYHVPKGSPIRNLLAVWEQNRLLLETGTSPEDALGEDIRQLASLTDKITEADLKTESADILLALSLPLWFCENVRIRRRY